jgi:CRISPR-associated exonuclease Cas4
LTLADGSMAPFDCKFAEYPDRIYHNQKMQSVLYGLLIHEAFERPAHRGFLCYLRSKNKVEAIEFTEADFAEAETILREILEVIQTGSLPRATAWKARCRGCCYRNIRIQ